MKTILLAVSGSIAFYKAYELISLFKKEGYKVKVLLSDGVLKFASVMSFEALADEVLHSLNESWENDKNHIAFSKDCDLVLFAPASINSINKLALGIADTLFIQTLIASKAPLIIAPAANTAMYLHFSTQKSLKLLEQNKALIIKPISKLLACKDEGVGALAEVESIFNESKRMLLKQDFWADKSVLITGGGTKEKIDEVRCISNFSSGKMARALADAFYFLGAKVTLLSSVHFDTPYELKPFESSKELANLLKVHKNEDYLFMVAAVSDFVCENFKGKIKKKDYPQGLDLHLRTNIDVLKTCGFKGKKIGFKMELDKQNALKNAQNMLKEKKLDMVCLNVLEKGRAEFGSEKSEFKLFFKDKSVKLDFKDKEKLAFEIAHLCQGL